MKNQLSNELANPAKLTKKTNMAQSSFTNQHKILWIQGVDAQQCRGILKQMFRFPMRKVDLTAEQWIHMTRSGGLFRLRSSCEMVCISDFEYESLSIQEQLLDTLESVFSFDSSYGVQLVLFSSPFFPRTQKFKKRLKSVLIVQSPFSSSPGDINDCVHALIERACQSTQRRVYRLTPASADFLEYCLLKSGAEFTYQVVLKGVLSMSNLGILNYEDLAGKSNDKTHPPKEKQRTALSPV